MVSYGSASGPVPPVELSLLSAKGSLFLTRPTLATHTSKRPDLEKAATDLFSALANGIIRASVNQTFPLQDAAAAHSALESRKTTGSTVLIP
jgi:NADPH2:quinone reductase